MAEKGISMATLSEKTNIERSKLYRRFKSGKITVEEAQRIKMVLDLSTNDAEAIFFDQKVAKTQLM